MLDFFFFLSLFFVANSISKIGKSACAHKTDAFEIQKFCVLNLKKSEKFWIHTSRMARSQKFLFLSMILCIYYATQLRLRFFFRLAGSDWARLAAYVYYYYMLIVDCFVLFCSLPDIKSLLFVYICGKINWSHEYAHSSDRFVWLWDRLATFAKKKSKTKRNNF